MDIIQLQDKQDGWRIHRFNDDESRDKMLAAHGITIGKGVTFANYVMIGDGAVLGDNVHLLEESVVSRDCRIGDNTLLEKGAFLSKEAQVGRDCVLSADSYVGPRTTLGDKVVLDIAAEIGESVDIGNDVHIGTHSYVMDGSMLRDGCRVGSGAYIGNKCKGGFFVVIGNDTQLVREVFVQDGVHIAPGSRIPPFAKVTRSQVQVEQERLKNAVAQMSRNIKYDQIATFTSLEGVRCIRAQVGGVWMPSERVEAADSRAFTQGSMSLKEMADKYIAVPYIRQNIESEARPQGMRR